MFVSVSRPHVTFHTMLLGHSSFICPSPPTFPSLLLPRVLLSVTSRTPEIVAAPEQRTQTKGTEKSEIID